MLVALAVGDAYGAGFEYVDRRVVKANNDLSGYVKHPRHRIKPGCYTDDTQMSLAIAELIVSGDAWTPENLADRFVHVFKRDPREGYAGGFWNLLKTVENGKELVERIRPNSDKSGAAMRAAPIGLFSRVDEVIEKATVQARITHDTTDGTRAAVAAALMPHYFIYRLGPKADLGEFIESHVPGDWSVPWRGEVGSRGWMSVRAAITAIVRHDTMSDVLRSSVGYSGDVDTVAAIAMAASSCCDDIVQDLPRKLVNRLENKKYGRDYLTQLDRDLLQDAGRGSR